MSETGAMLPNADHNLMGWRPFAAARYDGDKECQYANCDDEADFFVEFDASSYTGGRGCLCCGPCGEENRLYPEANDLTEIALSDEMVDELPSDIIADLEEVSA